MEQLYKKAVDSTQMYQRDGLIFAYIDFLQIPKTQYQTALDEYLRLKPTMTDDAIIHNLDEHFHLR